MPDWRGSDRRRRLPADWDRTRRRILRRDRTCRWVRADTGDLCREPATEVDHIIPSGSDEDHNLQGLCEYHHQRKSSKEGGDARAKARAKHDARFRRTEEHPALAARG